MKKGKILLSLALLCSPFWLAAAQNSGTSQNSSVASSASKISSSQSSRTVATSRSSTLPVSNPAANSTAPQSGNAANSMSQSPDGDNLGTIDVIGKADLSTTEGTGSYTTGNMSTATGLNLSIRETPQSVSVVSNQVIKDLNLNSVDSALRYTPGITLRNDSGRMRINSRGFDIDNIQEDGMISSVSSSVQGPLGFSKEFTDLALYDRVEVLRGVAGLTQSNGEPGGTVNLVRKRPSDEFGFNASLSSGSWDDYRSMIDVTDAINQSGTVRGRLIGVAGKEGAYKHYANGWRSAASGLFDFDIGEKTLLSTGVIYQKSRGVYDIFGIPVIDERGNLLNLSRKSYFGSNWDRSEYRKYNAFTELSHELSDDTKAYIKVNYTDSKGMFKFGSLGGVNPYNGTTSHNVRRQKYENTSKEVAAKIGLEGKYELFGNKHEFFIDGSASREKFSNNRKYPTNLTLNSLGMGIYNWNKDLILEPDWNNRSSLAQDYTQYNRIYQSAISLGTRYNLTEDWHILLGGRYSRVKYNAYLKDYIDLSETGKRDRPTKVHFAPYSGLTWDFTQNHSWYVSYAEIFKPQSSTDRNGEILDPVVGYNIETGVKGEYFEGALNTSIALFQIIQENRAIQDPLNTNYSIAEGKVRSRGVDVEAQGEITDSWKVFAGYTFNRSEYLKSEKANSTTVDYSKGANAKKYIPKHLFKIYTNYEIPFSAQRKLIFGVGMRYQSATSGFYQNANYVAPEQKAYTLWDANVGYHFDKHFSVNFAVKNITDKKYFQNTQNRVAGMNNYYGEPRNFMLTLNYTY